MIGNEMYPGDTIVASFLRGKTPCLRLGTIIEFVTKPDWKGNMTEQVKVMWAVGWNLPDSGESIIERHDMRIMKVTLPK